MKNAAGFDLPKFFVGSIGQFGALVEVSFKVFPQPPNFVTLHTTYADMSEAMKGIFALMTSPLETDAIDLEPHDEHVTVLIRIGGLESALDGRIERLKNFLNQHSTPKTTNTITDDDYIWQSIRELEWLRKKPTVVKVPLPPRQIVEFEQQMQSIGADVRYSSAGNVAWVALEDDAQFSSVLYEMDLVGLCIFADDSGLPFIGQLKGQEMLQRMKQVLDPRNIFGGVYATRD